MAKIKSSKTYKIEGMHCESCATMIELDLEDAGIKCKCDFGNKCLSVEDNSDEKLIFSIVSESGYKVVD
jgi:copper chaperone CopZ